MIKNSQVAFLVLGLCTFAVLSVLAEVESSEAKIESRNGKVFSLFSIVTFQNKGCQSTSGTTGSTARNRNGTCFTSTECANKGGQASGNCAAGFGVCCLFVVSAGSSSVSQNCSYIQNPSYPSVYSATTGLTYTVRKCSDQVCGLRLDFETFTLEGLSAFDETGSCKDSFIITASPTTFAYPTICGKNSGQHVYVDLGSTSSAFATLTFAFNTLSSTIRTWEIKVTQITCFQQNRPYDPSCFQYFTGLTGRIESFNFQEPTAASQGHLPSQDYHVCVRQEQGYCCIMYNLCPDTDSFKLDFLAPLPTATVVSSKCATDYLGIAGASPLCTGSVTGNLLVSRICGKFFSATSGGLASGDVCDCSAPFSVSVKFDGPAAIAETVNQRGFCLEYSQVPCQSS